MEIICFVYRLRRTYSWKLKKLKVSLFQYLSLWKCWSKLLTINFIEDNNFLSRTHSQHSTGLGTFALRMGAQWRVNEGKMIWISFVLNLVRRNNSNSDTNFSTTRHLFEHKPKSSVHNADTKTISVQYGKLILTLLIVNLLIKLWIWN